MPAARVGKKHLGADAIVCPFSIPIAGDAAKFAGRLHRALN